MSYTTSSGPQSRAPLKWGEGAKNLTVFTSFVLGTLNIGTLKSKSIELCQLLSRRKVDICCLQEVRYRNEGTRYFGEGSERYKLLWKGNNEGTNGVGILVKDRLTENILSVERLSDRIICAKVIIESKIYNFVSVYAPQQGRLDIEKDLFYMALCDFLFKLPNKEEVVIAGDMNGHCGSDQINYESVLGRYGVGGRNPEGIRVLDLCLAHNLQIANTFFRKREQQHWTYASGDRRSQLDLFLCNRNVRRNITNFTTFPGECIAPQHKLCCAYFKVRCSKTKKAKGQITTIKSHKLKDAVHQSQLNEKLSEKLSPNISWKELQHAIVDSARTVCGVKSNKKQFNHDNWWWDEAMRETLKAKREAYKKFKASDTTANKLVYAELKKKAKREVSRAKANACQRWCADLNSKKGREKMFRLARCTATESHDVRGGKFIKNESGILLTDGTDVLERWREYFDSLSSKPAIGSMMDSLPIHGPIREITETEVGKAVMHSSDGKTPGPSSITAEMLKALDASNFSVLTSVLQSVIDSGKIPDEWCTSDTVTIYKGKGDPLLCGSYRGIRLLEHPMKVFERVIESRLRGIVSINDRQRGFMPNRSATDAIHLLRRLQEKFLAKKQKLYHVFVDLEKAFDKVPRYLIEWSLRRQFVPENLVKTVMSLYRNSVSCMRRGNQRSNQFQVNTGVHQGSVLSPLLFILIIEELTKECGDGIPWEILFADDLVLTSETFEGVLQKFAKWRTIFESNGMKVNMDKTKLMVTGEEGKTIKSGDYPCGVCSKGVGSNSMMCTSCRLWVHRRCSGLRASQRLSETFVCKVCQNPKSKATDSKITLADGEIEKVGQFKYLGDMLHPDGKVETAVRARINSFWLKFRELSRLLLDKNLPLVPRVLIYKSCLRPVLLYGAETWSMTDSNFKILRSTELKVLRWVIGTDLHMITSRSIYERCGIDHLDIYLRRSRLRWFGHTQRSVLLANALTNVCVPGPRSKGRPKKTWDKTIEEDLSLLGLKKEEAMDRDLWKALLSNPV